MQEDPRKVLERILLDKEELSFLWRFSSDTICERFQIIHDLFAQQENQLTHMTTSDGTMRERMDQLARQIDALQAAQQSENIARTTADAEIDRLLRECEYLKRDSGATSTQYRELFEKVRDLEHAYGDLRSENNRLEEQNARLEAKLAQTIAPQEAQQLRDEVVGLRRDVAFLKDQLNKAAAALTSFAQPKPAPAMEPTPMPEPQTEPEPERISELQTKPTPIPEQKMEPASAPAPESVPEFAPALETEPEPIPVQPEPEDMRIELFVLPHPSEMLFSDNPERDARAIARIELLAPIKAYLEAHPMDDTHALQSLVHQYERAVKKAFDGIDFDDYDADELPEELAETFWSAAERPLFKTFMTTIYRGLGVPEKAAFYRGLLAVVNTYLTSIFIYTEPVHAGDRFDEQDLEIFTLETTDLALPGTIREVERLPYYLDTLEDGEPARKVADGSAVVWRS